MDEVWILSLCLTLFGFFIFILTLKPKHEEVPESISKSSTSSATAYVVSGGKDLEVSEDEVEKMMERLNRLLGEPEPPKKKEVYQERKKVVLEEEENFPHHRADMESTNETQEPVGKGPGHTQPAYQPSHQRVQDLRSAPAAVENIMDEIEQAVQETVEPDYYARRRQERAAARGRQWTETGGM